MEFSFDELKLIKSCLLISKETLRCMIFKNKKTNEKIVEIDNLLLRFKEIN